MVENEIRISIDGIELDEIKANQIILNHFYFTILNENHINKRCFKTRVDILTMLFPKKNSDCDNPKTSKFESKADLKTQPTYFEPVWLKVEVLKSYIIYVFRMNFLVSLLSGTSY